MVGIGGIGMSALAQYFKDHGVAVTGSDRDASPVTELLEKKGIEVVIGQKAENVPHDAELAVYSDSVPENNSERTRARELNIPSFSYFQMLGKVSEEKRTIAVAGTHGKTTTTGMLAKILQDAGASPLAVVGGIVRDFGSNYLHGDSDIFVVEACEYKNNFRFLAPHILVVTNIEWDHTDFYPSLIDVQSVFRTMIEKVPVDGTIVTNPVHPNIAPLLTHAKARVIDYTREPAYELRLPGEFNQNNARAAAAAARVAHPMITDETPRDSLAAFQGTWRRFEYKGKTAKGVDVYDDYAHHPTAVRVTLKALRAKMQAKTAEGSSPDASQGDAFRGKIIVAFHPHLYSRTRDLLDEFAVAFSDADKVFIAPIYAARETDDGTISSEILAERIRASGTNATALDFDAIEKNLADVDANDTIITMGAGDIYKVADALVGKK